MSSGPSEALLHIDGTSIPLLVRRYPHARSYRLRYDAGRGRLLLSMPARGALKAALAWAREQEGWVRGQMARTPGAILLAPGASLPVEGTERLISWDRTHARTPVLTGTELHVGGPQEQVGPRLLRWLRAHALATLGQETRELASREGLSLRAVSVGDPRSRWGSCSADGAIRYSWRLILAPPEVRLATVAHEVAHLIHMDHSPAFHAAHARLLGADPAPARAWLRAHGAALHLVRA